MQPQNNSTSTQFQTFEEFIGHYRSVLNKVFREPHNHNMVSRHRGIPPMLMRDAMQCRPLDVFISEKHGGYGGNVGQCLSMLEASSYESLPFALMMGINGALFIQPVTRYADGQVASEIIPRFAKEHAMGGLMITEPGYGSDALHMQTSYHRENDGYRLQGTKHWAGLTGWADYWLLTARQKKGDGALGRDIDFFIHDTRNPGVTVDEYFDNLGLYMLPYGRNSIDVHVPESFRLQPPSTGIKMMLDMLHRSRLQFPGMAMGFLHRIADDALDHVTSRAVGGRSLLQYDQVKERIVRIQSWFTSCAAMCRYTSENAPISKELSAEDVPANAIKSVVTDMMQDASQSFLQLVGAKGYRLAHLAGRGIIDSRPFQIFEGSNDILYQQITESVTKKMRKSGISSLYSYLKSYELTSLASEHLREATDFTLDQTLSQRKQVILGKMLGYTVAMNMVIQLGERGFQSQLIHNTIEVLSADIRSMLASMQRAAGTEPAEAIGPEGNWFACI